MVFENKLLTIIFVPEKEEVIGGGGKFYNWSFRICTLYEILLG
jgi:hypothetical protein